MVIIRKVLKVSGFKETGRVLALKALVLTLSLLLLGSLLIGVVSGWQVAGIRGYDVISLKHNSVISLDEAVLIYHNEVTMNRNIWPTSGCIEVQNEMNEHWRRFLHNSKLLEDAGICYAGGFNLPDKGIMFICLAKQVSENQRELILRIMGPFRKVRVVFYEANYPLKQLEEAKDKLTEWHLKTKAVPLSFVDACDVKNKLVVGLDISDLKPEYQKIVRQVVGEDTPIELVRAGPGGLDSKLNRYRPVFGGIQVETVGLSTLGFAALRGVPKGFVMTGHAGGVNTEVYQPIRAADNLIGRIGANPPGLRFSDSAWVPYDNVRGWIYCGISTTGYDYVVGSRPSSETRVNDPVHMQGRTSCGTSGRITLIGVNVQRHDMLLFNQVRANYISAGGDSRGPTYQIVRIVKPDYPKDVVVLGVHWGWRDFNGNGVRDPDETVYSPIEGVERNLGISVMK